MNEVEFPVDLMGADYEELFSQLLRYPVFGLTQNEKEQALLPLLIQLHELHRQRCLHYGRVFSDNQKASRISEIGFLAVRLFKLMELSSIETSDVFKILQSSGTTGQMPSRVVLDRATSSRQSKVLVKILQNFIGKQRLPMLIIDSPAVLNDKAMYSARGAGIQGVSLFGRDHTYALDTNMEPDWPNINRFVDDYGDKPVLLFGFTFMLWTSFIQALKRQNRAIALPHGVLLHSGGWKKLEAQKVDNREFKSAVEQYTKIQRVHNFYGMAEQVGSIFVECQYGHLHTPVFADVIVRDPLTLREAEIGQKGLIQVISCIPSSYPGHSILTEDLGEIVAIDGCPCGRKGKAFKVNGRLPKTEVRGCSDTFGGAV